MESSGSEWRLADPWVVRVPELPARTFLCALEVLLEVLKLTRRVAEKSLQATALDSFPVRPEYAVEAPDDQPRIRPQNLALQSPDNPMQPSSVKEKPVMDSSQDLSGDLVKVVQYCIVSVVPGIADNARVLVGPRVVAFADDMSAEDFTAWIIAENCPKYDKPSPGPPCHPPEEVEKCWDRKYLRVAFSVMGRFTKATVDWKELQALSVAKIAENWPPPDPLGEGVNGGSESKTSSARRPKATKS